MRPLALIRILLLISPTAFAQQCTVNWNDVHQPIEGFGASSAWRSSWTTAQADMFFSTNSGIGLSFLRNHINYLSTTAPTAIPSTGENTIIGMALARGAKVWSAPWTPAAGFKGPNANGVVSTSGGAFLGGGGNPTNLAYASQLANYVVGMKNRYGSNMIYALSVQNEPDFNTTNYESCAWTAQQIHDFVTNLSTALSAAGVGSTRIVIPESETWSGHNLYTATMNDPATASVVGIIANHNYDGCPPAGTPASPGSYGKSFWETEVSKLSCAGAYDGSMTDGLFWATKINSYLTSVEVNAWHYWWLIPSGSDNEGLTDQSGNPAKRMYVLGQWSRFVRPGYFRIGTVISGGTLTSAFKDPNSQNFAIVAINTTTADILETFSTTNFMIAGSVTPWITSATLSLSQQADVPVKGTSFACVIPAQSVVTLTGIGSTNLPPVLVTPANQSIDPGVTLTVTNTATDPNGDGLQLAFSLLQAPSGATLDSASGVFTWRAPVSAADSTNSVVVAVADNGTPSLSATNSFQIVVNPLAPASLSSIALNGGQITLEVAGPTGPDYTVLSSTNLVDWQALFTTNSPTLPFSVLDNAVDAAQFYRLQLGP